MRSWGSASWRSLRSRGPRGLLRAAFPRRSSRSAPFTPQSRRRRPRGLRVTAVAVATLAVLVLVAAVGYRMLRPQDMLTTPTTPYPEKVLITDERPHAELRAAPLIVEGRLRVYAEKWRVWSDGPVGERYESTPYWALRRWPAEVIGVVAAETTAGPVVVTQWSDGKIITLDARAGAVAWRAEVRTAGAVYDGRRTGASVVYDPRFLVVAHPVGRVVVVVTGTDALHAFDAATGGELWRRPLGCQPPVWTSGGLVAVPDCQTSEFVAVAADSGREVATRSVPAPGGRPTAALCRLGRSDCPVVTVGARVWELTADAGLAEVPPLERGAVLARDQILVYPGPTGVTARRLDSPSPIWTWTGKGRLIAADPVAVYLLSEDHTILGLNPLNGRLVVLGCASMEPNERWVVGHVHPTGDGYIAVERVSGAPATGTDDEYYFGPRPVALVEMYAPTKLPVWPGKFAACNPDE
jgi:outer membrane protein assembly factor BamB